MKRILPIPMKDISLEDRRKILLDSQILPSVLIREKWNITQNTLTHVRFFHGKSSAIARGYYHKDLLLGDVHPLVARIREFKNEGMTSSDVAATLGLSVKVVNKNWSI